VAVPGLESLQSPPFSSMHLVPPPEPLISESYSPPTGRFYQAGPIKRKSPAQEQGL